MGRRKSIWRDQRGMEGKGKEKKGRETDGREGEPEKERMER